jgi:PadR family transcriptional regulator PadR
MMTDIEKALAKLDKEMKSGLISLLVLMALKSEKAPSYGYMIIKRLKELSRDSLNFQEGTIYPVLRSLQSQGFLKSFWEESSNGPPRRYYELTPLGRTMAREALKMWRDLVGTSDEIFMQLEGSS